MPHLRRARNDKGSFARLLDGIYASCISIYLHVQEFVILTDVSICICYAYICTYVSNDIQGRMRQLVRLIDGIYASYTYICKEYIYIYIHVFLICFCNCVFCLHSPNDKTARVGGMWEGFCVRASECSRAHTHAHSRACMHACSGTLVLCENECDEMLCERQDQGVL